MALLTAHPRALEAGRLATCMARARRRPNFCFPGKGCRGSMSVSRGALDPRTKSLRDSPRHAGALADGSVTS